MDRSQQQRYNQPFEPVSGPAQLPHLLAEAAEASSGLAEEAESASSVPEAVRPLPQAGLEQPVLVSASARRTRRRPTCSSWP